MLIPRYTCDQARARELAQMRHIQEKYPHRHISNLKRKNGDWVPPPSSTGAEGTTATGEDGARRV
jgi:hypothetical protein